MDADRQMYDLHRLCGVIESMAHAPTDDICQRVFAEVAAYSPVLEDDRTLVVLRHTGEQDA